MTLSLVLPLANRTIPQPVLRSCCQDPPLRDAASASIQGPMQGGWARCQEGSPRLQDTMVINLPDAPPRPHLQRRFG